MMLCRVAENLFWVSRYMERAMAMARLVEVTTHLDLDAGESYEPVDLFGSRPTYGLLTRFLSEEDASGSPGEIRYRLASDPNNPNSIFSCVSRARASAREIRDSISSEMWEQVNAMFLMLRDARMRTALDQDVYTFFQEIRNGVQLFQGFAQGTMPNDEGWHFFNLGRYVERADGVARILGSQADVLLSRWPTETSADNTVRWLAVLRSAGCAEAYARYYSLRVDPARVVEFMLLNPLFPQSVRYSLSHGWESLSEIARPIDPGLTGAVPAVRTLGLLRAQLDHSGVDEVLSQGLVRFVHSVQNGVNRVTDEVTQGFFWVQPEAIRPNALAKAAMLMSAAQQQQQQQ
jgi:uncharacterized alpha-E superfamily protein